MEDRRREILLSAVQLYIQSGEPVGSQTLSKRSREGLSAATIRNVMADLVEEGFLVQPHISAGRMPTDQGYRFFVDEMSVRARLPRTEEERIDQMLEREARGTPQMMERISHLLAEITNHVGVVLSPRPTEQVIQHIEFVKLADCRILVVLVSRFGIIQNRLIQVNEDFRQEELDRTARYLMTNFPGRTLSAIRAELMAHLSETQARYDELLKNALLLCEQGLLDQQTESEVYVEGASKLVNHPAFAQTEKMKELLETIEEKSRLVRLLTECLRSDDLTTKVFIGSENVLPELHACSVVTAPYVCNDRVAGTIGIIGPKRMPYRRTIGVVAYMAKACSRLLSATN